MPREDDFSLSQPIFSEPVFGEAGDISTDPDSFTTAHPSDNQLYREIQDLLTKDVVAIPVARGNANNLYSLATAFGSQGPQLVQGIQTQGQLTFHVAGDTGASNEKKYQNEINVADALTSDIRANVSGVGPAFLYHVGDIVYDFGESAYYYDQFGTTGKSVGRGPTSPERRGSPPES